jgi:FSR family fosmidomycin resistance protein-like MFS transporter
MGVDLRTTRLVPAAYGVVHAVVDATTVAAVFGAIGFHAVSPEAAFTFVVLYDVLAFASQALLGLVTDRLARPRPFAVAGLAIASLAMACMPHHALATVLLAGLGNALFHVGGGALSLAVEPGRAAAAGIFVGPGALGLATGLLVSKTPFASWPFFVVHAAALALLIAVPLPARPYAALPPRAERVPLAALVVALLLVSVTIRSFVGMAASHACPKSLGLSIGLATAAFAGKALGGLVADRVGWTASSVGALLLSAPLLAYFGRTPSALVCGMFFFQMTMPVTLAALMRVFPRRPAFVFGLACVALVSGALPTFTPTVTRHYSGFGFFALIVLSATSLAVALRDLGPRELGPRAPDAESPRDAQPAA